MSLELIIDTSIFTSEADLILIPVNTSKVMGAGIAKQFKNKHPQGFKEYVVWCERGSPLPGIWNNYGFFPTKKHWKDKSDYRQIKRDLSFYIGVDTIQSIAVPPLGCGLGGLEPNEYIPKLVWDCYTLSTTFNKHVEFYLSSQQRKGVYEALFSGHRGDRPLPTTL